MSSDGISQNHLNGYSGFILGVFVVVSIFVIWPARIPLPGLLQSLLLKSLKALRIIGNHEFDSLSSRKLRFPLSLETAPLIGVIILLASTTIDGSTIRLGVKGDENVKPYDVLVLFISLVRLLLLKEDSHLLGAGLHLYRFGWNRSFRGSGILGFTEGREFRSPTVHLPLYLLSWCWLHSRQ